MFQHFVECDPEDTYFEMVKDETAHSELRKIMVFDLVANNADRKGGHCIRGADNRIWSIDHGLTFHTSFKLRTVMMEFWGSHIPDDLISDLRELHRKLDTEAPEAACLMEHLRGPEIKALKKRIRFLLKDSVVPKLDPNYNIPWPFV